MGLLPETDSPRDQQPVLVDSTARKMMTQESFPSIPPLLRPRVLAGWRIVIFAYLLLGGVLLAFPAIGSLGIHAFAADSPLLKVTAGLLFTTGVALLVLALVTALGMARDQARSILLSRLFCIGKIAFACANLLAARFIFRSWGFTSPPEAIVAMLFAGIVFVYLVASREARAIAATAKQ